MGKFFGTDGVRGEANSVLTADLAYRLGRASAHVLKEQSTGGVNAMVIGKDTRISGDMLEASLIAGICSAGVDVYKAGVIPTPAVAVLTRHLEALAGVVISASHNPYDDNGIKFFNPNGQKLSDQQELAIEALLEGDLSHLPQPVGAELGRVHEYSEGAAYYSSFIKEKVDGDFSGLKIVVDCANGAASKIAPQLLQDMGAEVMAIYHSPNGVNINDNCGSTHLTALQHAVVEESADLGLAYDGDADRLQAVDHEGQVVDGDQLLAIFARYLKAEGQLTNDLMVATIMSNMGLKAALRSIGVSVAESQVGDRYVIEKMEETGAILGGEQSGHIIFKQYNTTGDGIMSSMKLLEIVKKSQSSLKELAAFMDKYPQVLVNVPVVRKEGWQQEAKIQEAIARAEAGLGERGRILVRASGTENLLRVMVEGQDQAEIKTLAETLAAVVDGVLGKGSKS